MLLMISYPTLRMNNHDSNRLHFANYWNKGVTQNRERYFDNIVISTSRVLCDCK